MAMGVHPMLVWLSAVWILLSANLLSAAVVPTLSGPPNVMGSGTYPRANFLQDGSIIGAFTAFEGGDSIITLVRSTDDGVTWAQIGTAARGPTATKDIDNPYPLQLPSGRVLVAFREHDREGGVYSFFRITVCYSDDAGATWAYLSTPASDPGPTTGNWEPLLRTAQDGSLQIYYSRENGAADQDSLMRTSTDGGGSWSAASTISGGELTDARDGMLGVAAVSGSAVIAVFESSQGGLFTVNSVTSGDDGRTWGNRQRVYAPTGTGNNAASPQVVNVGGTLVASFMTDEDTSEHSGDNAKVLTSGDGGVTGEQADLQRRAEQLAEPADARRRQLSGHGRIQWNVHCAEDHPGMKEFSKEGDNHRVVYVADEYYYA